MRNLNELINLKEPGWRVVQEWLQKGKTEYRVLPGDRHQCEETLLALQVTTRSPMGAVALETGGIWFDSGWLRFLGGSSSTGFPYDMASFNRLSKRREPAPEALVVAWDVAGGFFALNGGMFEGELSEVYYFGPDSLEWESLETGYAGLLGWATSGDLDEFYRGMRWAGWREEIATLPGNFGLSVRGRRRTPAPVTELWNVATKSMATYEAAALR